MESDDDLELLPPSPVQERKLKRLKKAARAPQPSHPPISPPNFSDPGNTEEHLTESNPESGPQLETFEPSPISQPHTRKGVTVDDDGLGAKRVLDFDSVGEEHGNVAEESQEEVTDLKTNEEIRDLNTEEVERKRRSFDDLPEKNEKKKKKRIDDSGVSEKKLKEPATNKRKAEKERRETLKQLRADSQRLLRETRDAAFKPAPLVQKPITSILEKIRQRKLEILKKSADNIEKAEPEETPATCHAASKSDLDTSHTGQSNDAADDSNSESIPSPMAKDSESEHAFRAPIGDTQELYTDSERSDSKDEAVNEKFNNPLEEVLAPSVLAMNLKFDSAPPDDDVFSDEEEDNDKENIEPHVHGPVDSTLPSGDLANARDFLDEEAEEEDDSDNDRQRFQDNEDEDDDDDDIVNDMIATQYEEKSDDREKRDQLHQQWLEQQDAAGVDNLLHKLKCGSKLNETPSTEEEDEESRETEYDDEAEEYTAPSESLKTTLKKVKQMIPHMFSDKDDKYVSSDDEETEDKLARQCLYYKTEEKAKFFSPAEDESSREVFSLIKKLNVPDAKRKGKTTSIFAMPSIGQSVNTSSKSSFLGRASDRFMPPSQKQGSCKIRSYIFGRDDSNIRSSILMSEDSSDTIQMASQPPKAASAKFQRNTQNKNTTLNSASEESNVSLLDILRKSSHHAERTFQNADVQQTKSIFDAFKLVKKPTEAEASV